MAKTMEEVLERFRTIEFHDDFDMIVAIAKRHRSGRHHQSAFTKRSASAAHQFEGRISAS